ncbi:hypothetical protein CALVIDRAFT_141751 [Calocera viscosa TUFC12733]|uniref:Uncharacterized protein n=1 Tax=Calocera viscosa (strain TUFC12733) TaxID=1330018 RepID=A0A167LQ32_CALVF|nr:hypothetical protein CALVIDRAFT_141751 [Calocera viscosa TUFC12733]
MALPLLCIIAIVFSSRFLFHLQIIWWIETATPNRVDFVVLAPASSVAHSSCTVLQSHLPPPLSPFLSPFSRNKSMRRAGVLLYEIHQSMCSPCY